MITGLDITGSVHPWDFKGSSRQTGVKPGSGYKNYILNHMKDGPLGEVEYRAFLNMWLCRFIFCGKANEPTLNHIAMASHLVNGNHFPLGKYLLGSVYHMLHQTVTQMYTSQRIVLTRNVHLAPNTQQAEQAGFTRAESHETCQSIFPEN
jgi:hypothetical protein